MFIMKKIHFRNSRQINKLSHIKAISLTRGRKQTFLIQKQLQNKQTTKFETKPNFLIPQTLS